ncbi:MAG: phosphatase PAP2 family protein [Alphaproteobacteria bacterium]|nr:phosphatase PAP2 family protein [Alphaproteobacteria bacterium]
MKNRISAIVVAGLLCTAVPAQASTSTETLGTATAIALPLVAGSITLWKDDLTGTAQVVTTTFLTVGTVYGLKHFVRECRPFATPCSHSSSNWDSFPSDTSALAFVPAQFLWQRYGWEYGLPAYAAATFVGWSRVDAQKHHWWDVATSAAISFGYNELFTTRYRPHNGFSSDLSATPDGIYANVNYRW